MNGAFDVSFCCLLLVDRFSVASSGTFFMYHGGRAVFFFASPSAEGIMGDEEKTKKNHER
jgi:hypothetical protein